MTETELTELPECTDNYRVHREVHDNFTSHTLLGTAEHCLVVSPDTQPDSGTQTVKAESAMEIQ